MIRAVIVDDEKISLAALATKIKTFCPEIDILELFDDPRKAQKQIPHLQPDIVFLDIEMPNMNGFTLLKGITPLNFEVIFTTAYVEFAIEALRISALDFLLKPIDSMELVAAVDRLKLKIENRKRNLGKLEEQLQIYFQYEKHPQHVTKIALPVLNGLEFVEINDVIKIHGENVYSVFYFRDGKKLVVSRTLKEMDKLLSRWSFMRVHKSFIINLAFITRYIKGEGGTVILSDGSEVEVSRRNKNEFLSRVSK